jgi:Sjoegren syndrome nuclear autoantigen 1
LVKCLEDLREKREQVNKAILKEEKEKGAIQKQVRCVTE